MLVQFHKKNLKNDNYEFLHMAFIESNQQAIETMEHIDFNILDVGDIIWPEIMIVARPTDDAWIGIDQLDSYNADQVKLGIKKYLNDKPHRSHGDVSQIFGIRFGGQNDHLLWRDKENNMPVEADSLRTHKK